MDIADPTHEQGKGEVRGECGEYGRADVGEE